VSDAIDDVKLGLRPSTKRSERPPSLAVAKALGLTIPQSILLRADRVIE